MGRAILDGNPISYFPNGFPLLIAGIMLISAAYTPVIIVSLNIILQLAVMILIEKMLTAFNVEKKVRLVILFIISIYPHQVSTVRFIMTESVSTFLILLTIFIYSNKRLILSGILGYLSFAFRPTFLLATPLIIIYDLINKNKKRAAKTIIGFIAGLLLFNSLEFYGIIATPSSQNYNLLVAINANGYDINYDLKNFTKEELDNPVKTYFNFALKNPAEFVRQRLLSIWALWGPIVPSKYGTIGMVLHSLRFPFFVLAACAFFFRNKIGYDKNFILLLSYPVISLTLIHFFFFSTQRHQASVEPFVIFLSVLFLDYFIKLVKRRKIATTLILL